jgi:hypothetical protein
VQCFGCKDKQQEVVLVMQIKHLIFIVVLVAPVLLKAQENKTLGSGEVSAQNKHASSIQISDEKMQESIQRFKEYQLFMSESVIPLAMEGRNKGITATPEEISAQQKAYFALFPGVEVPSNFAQFEIIAKKYARTLAGNQLFDNTIQNAYAQVQKGFSQGDAPSFDDLQPLLETRALLGTRLVQETVQQIGERLDKEVSESYVSSQESWPDEDMRIRGRPDQCLVEHKDSAKCLLTVKKYNEMVRYHPISNCLPLDSARVAAIKNILTDWYIACEARKSGFASSDSAAEEKRNIMHAFVNTMKYKKIGTRIFDRNALWRTYSMFYEALFKTRYYPYFSIVGSNDSLYIDSLSRLCKKIASKDSSTGEGHAAPSSDPSTIPWSYSYAVMLPGDFDHLLDTLRVGSVSDLFRTPYGFFLVRIDSVQTRYEIPFEEAGKYVVPLASKQKWRGMDSLLLEKARSIYASNKRLNRLPDTLAVKAVIAPRELRDSIAMGKTITGKDKRVFITNDSLAGALSISSALLPPEVRDALLNGYEAAGNKNTTIGPIPSRFGVWYFKVLEKKSLGGVRPFSAVRKQLIDSLVVGELDEAADTLWQKPDSAFDEMALAQSYSARFFGVADNTNEDADQSEKARQLREQKAQERSAEIEAWLSKITIHSIISVSSAQ